MRFTTSKPQCCPKFARMCQLSHRTLKAPNHLPSKMAESEQHRSVLYRRVFSLLRLCLLAVHHVDHLVDETDDCFRYFACYEYAKRNNLQNQITLHLTPPCSINLKFLTSFFKIGSFCACSVFVIVCL